MSAGEKASEGFVAGPADQLAAPIVILPRVPETWTLGQWALFRKPSDRAADVHEFRPSRQP